MKSLTLGAGHSWVLMSPWRMDVKWYMKCFISWTKDFAIYICIELRVSKSTVQYMKHFIYISLYYNYSIRGFISDCCLMLSRFCKLIGKIFGTIVLYISHRIWWWNYLSFHKINYITVHVLF